MSLHLRRTKALTEIILDRPPVNAFDLDQVTRLADAVEHVRRDAGTRCILIYGVGNFSAGADIAMLASWRGEDDRRQRTLAFVARMQRVFTDLANLPIPSIAAITGAATGGGLELALACDLRIAAHDARLGLPEVRIGLIPGAGGTQRLTRLAGPSMAAQMILTGEPLTGQQAAHRGITQLAPSGERALDHARATAEAIAALPAEAVAEAKRCIALAGTPGGYGAELAAVERLIATQATDELLAAFVARRTRRAAPSGAEKPISAA